MRTGPVAASRFALLLATLFALAAEIVGGTARADAKPDSSAFEDPSRKIESRIESLIRRWLGILEDPGAVAKALSDLPIEAPFELFLEGEVLHDRDALLAWVSKFRAAHPKIEHRLVSIRIQAGGRDLHRVRFEFDRHTFDDAELPHVARREHTWIVRSDANAAPVILKIEERPLLFFTGTGPQIVCY